MSRTHSTRKLLRCFRSRHHPHTGHLARRFNCQFGSSSQITTSIAPHGFRAALFIRDWLVCINTNMDTPPALCGAHVADILDERYKTFTRMYTDGFVDLLHGTTPAAFRFSAFGINLIGLISLDMSAVTAVLSAIRFSLEFLHHIHTSQPAILRDSRAAFH